MRMVPIWDVGDGSAFEGSGVYLSSMVVVGLNWVFIRARLERCVSPLTSWGKVGKGKRFTLELHLCQRICRGSHRVIFEVLLLIIRIPFSGHSEYFVTVFFDALGRGIPYRSTFHVLSSTRAIIARVHALILQQL